MYQETGNTAKSQAFVSSFLSQFNSSPLASNKRIKQSVDATLLRHKLIGIKAPSIEGIEYIDMPKTSIGELNGKVIMLDFLAHWCAPCIESFPETNLLKQKYESKGLVIVGVTNYYGFFGEQENLPIPDELAALKKLKLQRNANFGFIVGPRTNEQAYGVAGLPAVVLIDRQGKVRYSKQGAGYKKEIEKIIRTLVTENITN
jgi:thiol-disulfide isomerase/thioredoxin